MNYQTELLWNIVKAFKRAVEADEVFTLDPVDMQNIVDYMEPRLLLEVATEV